MEQIISPHIISYCGKILFEPENVTKKHEAQSSWKKVAMILFEGDIPEYYSWFLKQRFNLELNKPLRDAHVTFINDSMSDLSIGGTRTDEQIDILWEEIKEKWNGKEISVIFNLRPFNDLDIEDDEADKSKNKSEKLSDTYHWWLIVDHKFREEIHAIRAELGLGKPYFGLHMTFGILTQNYKIDKDGKLIFDSEEKRIPIFNYQLEHAKYLNVLHEKGFIEMNKDYGKD